MSVDRMKKVASNILKAELAKRGLKFQQLHEKLCANGVEDSYNTMRLKINRGTFSFAFFLKCAKALDIKKLDFESYLSEE